jgi:hypothetical protein
MRVTVLVEPITAKSFRAITGDPLGLTAEGETPEEALQRLRKLIQDRLANGTKLIQMEIAAEPHPLLRWAGTWKPDDPFIEEWKRAVEEYRQEVENDPDR